MKLSKRLQRVTANVLSGGVVADIGCDHGFTSIYLIQRGMAVKAIATDINIGPLERARKHVHEYGMEDKILLRLSDGAKEIVPGEADTILISGMGGALIARILREGEEVIHSAKELVLSPQSEVSLVRVCIHEMGFRIVHEEMVIDQGKFYVVIRAVAGQEKYQEPWEYIYGKYLIENKDPVCMAFLEKEQGRVDKILDRLSKQEDTLKKRENIHKIEKERIQITNVLEKIKETIPD